MYHSALNSGKSDGSEYRAIGRYELAAEGSVAFAYDLSQSSVLPKEYDACDLLYSEVPWAAGYKVFVDRAGSNTSSYQYFLNNVAAICRSEKRAVVLVVGKAASRVVQASVPDSLSYDITLNGGSAVAMCWNVSLDSMPTINDTPDTISLLAELAGRFDCVGDFCCGFGVTGNEFRKRGKRFVMSDINKRCIGAISQNIK